MIQESDNFQIENEIRWENVGEGISRQILAYNEDIMMVKVKFETGVESTLHAHPHTQVTYVVSGIFEFTTNGETRIVRSGDGVYMKSGVLHGCKCIEAGLLIDTFSPIREDFIK
ncbi:cupin domain-containing protein [Coprobacter sp.]